MSDCNNAQDSRVYNASRGGATCFAAIFLIGSAVLIERGLVGPAPAMMVVTALPATGLAIAGLLKLINAICGLPQLDVTRSGIELKTLFKTTRANWSGLSAFDVITYYRGGRRAEANFVGPDGSGDTFAVPNVFSIEPDEIARELNAARAQALGLPEPAAEDARDTDGTGGLRSTLALAAGAFVAVLLGVLAATHR